MAVYLGFDSSTQSLSVIAIEVNGDERRVIYETAVYFDADLRSYKTRNGVLPSTDPFVAHSSPLMWGEALDRVMERVAKEGGFPLSEIRAVAGSGQQHGSVYLNASASSVLQGLDPQKPLMKQIRGVFSRETSPVWMDSSTAQQCREITESVGGEGVLAVLTGSRAFERFTGPQIRKYQQEDPDGYEQTDKIHLVSSYMATLLAGRHAPIDPGDGAGMNLMDLAHRTWAAAALQVTAPNLEAKLPPVRDSWTIVGTLSPYWVERYGFSPATQVVAWSGDNPCSLIGVGLIQAGRIAISLGTSDTLFGFMPRPRVDPLGGGHVFGSPTGDFMSLICFKNGSLARQRIRDDYGMDWDGFSDALRTTKPGNGGCILLPWIDPEITPTVLDPGIRRYGLDPQDAKANIRAVVEAQMLSMSIHSQWMGVEFKTIYATGGAAKNQDILRIMADVHDSEVYQFEVGNSACLGAALRAFHADKLAGDERISWEEVTRGFTEPVRESRIEPDPVNVEIYRAMRSVYLACEANALRGGEDPTSKIEAFRAILRP